MGSGPILFGTTGKGVGGSQAASREGKRANEADTEGRLRPGPSGAHTHWPMASRCKAKIKEKDLHGLKHFKLLLPILEHLHDGGCGRGRAA